MKLKKIESKLKKLPFTLVKKNSQKANLGLLVLESDLTIEDDFKKLTDLPSVSVFHSRIANEPIISEHNLSKMEKTIVPALRLLPEYLNLSVLGYGCTSGASIIGEKRINELVRTVHPDIQVTNPLTAAKLALKVLKVKDIALITPYSTQVTRSLQAQLNSAGFSIEDSGSFFEENDRNVGNISEESILSAIIDIGKSKNCDGVFVSCTNLKTASIIDSAEKRLQKPVTSSNHALAWHMLRLSGINYNIMGLGALFRI